MSRVRHQSDESMVVAHLNWLQVQPLRKVDEADVYRYLSSLTIVAFFVWRVRRWAPLSLALIGLIGKCASERPLRWTCHSELTANLRPRFLKTTRNNLKSLHHVQSYFTSAGLTRTKPTVMDKKDL